MIQKENKKLCIFFTQHIRVLRIYTINQPSNMKIKIFEDVVEKFKNCLKTNLLLCLLGHNVAGANS